MISIAISGATVLACGQIAGIDDAPVVDEGTVTPGNTPPNDKPGGTIDERNDSTIVILPQELDFGAVPCGSTSLGKLITIQNTGSSATTYEVALPANPSFTVMGALSGPLAAKSSVTLQAFAKPAVANENTTDLVVSAGGAVRSLKPKVRGMGAALEIVPPLWNFGEVRKNTASAPVPFDIVNRGNAPAVITAFAGLGNFAVTGLPLPVSIEGDNAKVTIQANMTAGLDSPTPVQEVMTVESASNMCAVSPSLTLKGKRVNADVLISSGDWGKVDCVPTPNAKDITLSNYSLAALTYTASLQAGSAFTIVSGMTGTVPMGNGGSMAGTQKVVVKPNGFTTALGAISETLTVTWTSASPPPNLTTPLTVDYRGSIVTSTPLVLTFVSDGNTKATKSFVTTNTGNEPVYLDWYLARTSGGSGWSTSPPFMLSPGSNPSTKVDFLANTNGTTTAQLYPERNRWFQSRPICNAVARIELQGSTP